MDYLEVVRILNLEPLPREGGFFRRTWSSPREDYGSAIYYLMDQASGNFSRLHILQEDEVYHFYAGSPSELHLFFPSGQYRRVVLGVDLAAGQRPQFTVPAGTIQGGRVVPGGCWSLLGTTMAPGFRWEMFSLPGEEHLRRTFPDQGEIFDNLL